MPRLMLLNCRRLARFTMWLYHAIIHYLNQPEDDAERDPLLNYQTLTCAFCGYEHGDGVACDDDW